MQISRVIYFRTNECQLGNSCQFDDNQSLNCFDYHQKSDRRRFPYTKNRATGEYTLNYIDELCKKRCNKDDCPFAHNIYEQNYHPMRIKKEVCSDQQGCQFKIEEDEYLADTEEIVSLIDGNSGKQKSKNYCYKFHKNSEKEYYDQLRKKFEPQYIKMRENLLKNKLFVQGVADVSTQHDKEKFLNSTILNYTEFINEQQNHDIEESTYSDFNFQSSIYDQIIDLNDTKQSPFGLTVANNNKDESFLQNEIIEEENDNQSDIKQINKNEIINQENNDNNLKSQNSKNQKSYQTKDQKKSNFVSNSNKQIEEDKKSKQSREDSPLFPQNSKQMYSNQYETNNCQDNQQKSQKFDYVIDKAYQQLQDKILGQYTFVYNEIFDEDEGQMLEFKDYYFNQDDDSMNNGNQNLDIIINRTIQTILGFLNSKGGFIIFGIKDNKKIKGSQMNMDKFMNQISPILARCQPPVLEKHHKLHRLNLIGNQQNKIVILQVMPQKHKLFFDSKSQYFRRTNASVIKHENKELSHIMMENYKEYYKKKQENLKTKLEMLKKKEIEEEKQKIIDQQKRDYLALLKYIKSQSDINKITGVIEYKIQELENN
ncbi:divergent AAA domain protein (macronuclear) [Tetrahymena thermophila SB210]|uniref:Divergent AAA domain protein n=1 Tax=Tetrahymena thermophila (strain SB210) TaxID=312017 RepID=I7MKC3_TETTS|nr:divergent AAA domain protein [Tetrahymena thermophila SB210]EAR98154.2 divergent AAA domain protein [Tetrahymena thermophila SB210]|eukprot:XP_001018399.2 divergent AAA domain protein [Tetrahymena thermophila SB210]